MPMKNILWDEVVPRHIEQGGDKAIILMALCDLRDRINDLEGQHNQILTMQDAFNELEVDQNE